MNRGLVIGCSEYEDPDIAPLRYAHRDASQVAQALRLACDVEGDALVMLHDRMPDPKRKATRTNILRQLTQLARTAGDADILFFFFSGHGFQTANGKHYLLPVDCVRDAIEETALSFDLIVQHLAAVKAPHVVLLLDACRNVIEGGKSAGFPLSNVDVNALCPPGVVTFCSCTPGTVSYEAEAIRAGIFTQAFCEAFSDQNRCRTVYELDSFLNRRVPEVSAAQGKPSQAPYSRVEPLGVQQLEIVSARKRNEWRAATPIGAERRTRKVLIRSDSVSSDPFVGIDFGTSYSAISHHQADGTVQIIPGPDGRLLMPSVVHFLPGFDYVVGSAAVEADIYRPSATIRHVKRVLGTDMSFEIDGRSIAPEFAASLIIRSLVRNAEEALGKRIKRCLAARPANFSNRQVEALQRAFELADLEVFRIVGEPNIATILNTSRDDISRYLVVDLGGGTFDVALVGSSDSVAEIEAVAGSNKVGGLDFDSAVAEFAEERLRADHRWEGDLPQHWRAALLREAERAKRDLGRRESSTILLQDLDYGVRGLQDVSIDLTRALFRDITANLNQIIFDTLQSPFIQTGTNIADWMARGGKVILAGQGGKIFTVREKIDLLLHGAEVLSEFQETAVVQGLGMYTGVFLGIQKDILLLDALGYGVGLRVSAASDNEFDKPHVIAADPSKNKLVVTLADALQTIPTIRSAAFAVDEASESSCLTIVEISGPESADWASLPFPSTSGTFEISVDIDASHTIVIAIKNRTTNEASYFQINNPRQRHVSQDYAAARYVGDVAPRPAG